MRLEHLLSGVPDFDTDFFQLQYFFLISHDTPSRAGMVPRSDIGVIEAVSRQREPPAKVH